MTNNDMYIKGLRLIGWQKTCAKVFKSLTEDEILVIKAARQKGKSIMLQQILLYVSLNNVNAKSYCVSPTNRQCRKMFNDIKDGIAESPLVVKMNESTQEIQFINGSTIFFVSAESGDNLRGNTVKNGGVLVIDEMAFIKDSTIAILLPYVTVSHANIICVSTPRRKNGTFYKYWSNALCDAPGFKGIDVNEFDNSFFISDEQIEMYKTIMSPEKFKNEILGQFTEMNEGVFGDYSKHFFTPEDKEVVYVGIDWSTSGSDKTVISGFNKYKQQCFLWSDKYLEPLARCKKIAEILNGMQHIKEIKVEKNSIGEVYASMLKSLYHKPSQIKEFITSNTSKREIIENMIRMIGQGEITLLPDEEQAYQLDIFVQIPLSNGNYTYANDPTAENGHDDYIMATAIAIDCFSSNSNVYTFGCGTFSKPTYRFKTNINDR